MQTDQIPVIDIGRFDQGTRADKDAVKAAVADALERVGFMIVTGHGVPADTIAALASSAKRFFALPAEDKLGYVNSGQALNRGYLPPEGEILDGKQRVPDLKEAFVIGRPDVDDRLRAARFASSAFAPNVWPTEPEDFRASLEAYYHRLRELSQLLLRIFAYTLELSEDFFDDYFDRHPNTMRVQNYPALRAPPREGQLRAAAHRDYGAFTILREVDLTGGLQCLSRSGQWLDVRSSGDSFIINIGDVMMRWTNDRWISNLHRVDNPRDEATAKADRLSVPYFVHPNPDAMIACLPTCQSDANPARYSPIAAAENRMQQLHAGLVTPPR